METNQPEYSNLAHFTIVLANSTYSIIKKVLNLDNGDIYKHSLRIDKTDKINTVLNYDCECCFLTTLKRLAIENISQTVSQIV